MNQERQHRHAKCEVAALHSHHRQSRSAISVGEPQRSMQEGFLTLLNRQEHEYADRPEALILKFFSVADVSFLMKTKENSRV
jgi:hypothetical protein